jgi:Tetracyclin repressor-like, C-terminal domain
MTATEVGDQGAAAHELLSRVVDGERFPALRRALDAGLFDPSKAGRDAGFAFGLERVLDGIERLLERRDGTRSGATRRRPNG